MEDKSVFVEYFGDAPVVKIIDFLLDNSLWDYSKKTIAEGAEVSRAALFANWSKLEKYGIIMETRRFGKTKLYKLNKKSPIVQILFELDFALCEAAAPQDVKQVAVHKQKYKSMFGTPPKMSLANVKNY